MKIRNYSELILLGTFDERFEYLKLQGQQVGVQTFGFDRYLNQTLYRSREWRHTRDIVIVRDDGCDLGILDYPISYGIRIHHMNPITIEDIEQGNPDIFDPEFLISTSIETHNGIHYGENNKKTQVIIDRFSNDQTPWRRGGIT